jgi:hypothetical protein
MGEKQLMKAMRAFRGGEAGICAHNIYILLLKYTYEPKHVRRRHTCIANTRLQVRKHAMHDYTWSLDTLEASACSSKNMKESSTVPEELFCRQHTY